MLAKVITLAHGRAGNGFGPVLRYVLRVDQQRATSNRSPPECGHVQPAQLPYWSAAEDAKAYTEDLAQLFDEQARHCRSRGRFRGNAVYHVAINWMEGEHPTRRQAERASRHVMHSLGFGQCQALWAIHRDTDHDHVHLVINRVHPEKLTAVSVPWRHYLLLDRCMRELELEMGFARTSGPYVTVDTAEGPKIVRMSRAERERRGLLLSPQGPRISPRAERAEHNLAAASFQRWLTGAPSAALQQTVTARGATWQHAHAVLAEFGCIIRPKGSGLVVTSTLSNGRVLAAKASLLGRWASKASLERVLGPYKERAPGFRWSGPRKSYEQFIEREHAAEGPHEAEREGRRAERAEGRRQLAERFAREGVELQARRRRERELLRQRQERERRQLASSHRGQRRRAGALSRARQDGGMALALWAFAAAREREALQHRHANERRTLTNALPRGQVWRCWLESEAAAGDEAAQAALRGIRYRERRKERLEEAISGAEISWRQPLTIGNLRAEVDLARQVIVYRRSDGSEAFRDVGPKILMRDKSDESVEAALRVAAQKYGGRVQLTGSEPFRERAARMATGLGIVVENTELQAIVREERLRVAERWGEPRVAPTFTPKDPPRPRPGRSRGLER